MKPENQKWAVLDIGDGWQVIIPDVDTKPHAKIILIDLEKNEQTATVAGWDCPCRPHVDWTGKMIIHNSFLEQELTVSQK